MSSAAENVASPSRRKRREPSVATAPEDPTNSSPELDDHAWKKFAKRVAKNAPAPLHRRVTGRTSESPLLWGVPVVPSYDATRAVVRRLHNVTRQGARARRIKRLLELAEQWVIQEPLTADQPKWLLEGIAWAHAAPYLITEFPQRAWQRLVDRLVAICRDASQPDLNETPWSHQLLAELATTLAYNLPELAECVALAAPARDALTHGICELTDGQGLLHGRHLDLLRPLLGCWTRCLLMSRESTRLGMAKEAEIQIELLVEHAIRWTRRDGSQVLGATPSSPWDASLLATALALTDDRQARFMAATVLPSDPSWSKLHYRALRKSRQPEPSYISEWAAAAVLRSDWSRRSPQLAVRFVGQQVQSELSVGRRVLWSGPASFQFRVDGRELRCIDDWEAVCQFSDKDTEYLELQANLEGGWRIERQMLLARTDGFVLVADALLGGPPAELQYTMSYPLAAGVTYRAAAESHEGHLVLGEKTKALLLPLALPEWRADRPVGELRMHDGQLTLSQQRHGRAMFCPLFIDLKRKRMDRPVTWRSLTVAADRTIQPSDVAVGYRVQIGKRQWLVYRAMAERACRSVLGQHVLHDFVVGRFTRDGKLDELVQVES